MQGKGLDRDVTPSCEPQWAWRYHRNWGERDVASGISKSARDSPGTLEELTITEVPFTMGIGMGEIDLEAPTQTCAPYPTAKDPSGAATPPPGQGCRTGTTG